MLRHSDRAVMLLDLDKAYSDALDQTSGGTAYYSAPVSTGEKPTAQKDFTALGRIIDYMEDNVTDFPASKFRRIKKACLSGTANAYVLTNLLTRKSYGIIWTVVTILLTVIVCTIVIIWNTVDKDWIDSDGIPIDFNQDSIMNEVPAIAPPLIEDSIIPTPSSSSTSRQSRSNGSISIQQSATSGITIDIDTPMAEFTSKLEASYKELTSGITRNRLRDIMSELITLHNQAYFKILDDTKLRYPDIPGIDVDLEVARRFEKSKPGKLYVKFNKTVSDSLRVWDKDSL